MSRNNSYESNRASKLWLAGLAAVIVIGLALFRHTHRNGAPVRSETTATDGDGKPLPKADKFGVLPGFHSVTAESRFLVDIPWNEFPLTSDGSLRVVMEPRKWCTVGDLDMIVADGRISENPNFLMTIEPLAPEDSSFAPLVRKLSAADVMNGFRHTFRLPAMKKGMQAGLFVCKDSAGTGRCNTEDREVIDMNRALVENAEKGKKNPAYRPPDRVYYFQYLYLTASNKVASFMNPEVPDITFDAVNARLKNSQLAAKELEEQQRALGRAKRLQQTLRSLPLEQGPGYARIVLPQLDGDKKHCPKVGANR